MEYGFSDANQALWAAGKLVQVVTKTGQLLPILRNPVTGHIVEIAKAVGSSAAPLIAAPPPMGLAIMLGQVAMGAGQMYQNHRGFQAVLSQLNLIKSTLGVLQTTTNVIGVGVAVGAVISAVNLHQTLKLREDVKKLRLEVKDGLIDLKQVLKDQGSEILQRIDQVAQDVEFIQHRTILSQGYGRFVAATQLIETAMLYEDMSSRKAELANVRQSLKEILADYNNPDLLLSETCAAGKLRRLECSWAIEQTIAITYQLQNELTALSKCLSDLQSKIRQDTLTVIENCKTEDELDFLFPEIKRIHDRDLAALEAWRNQVDWMRSLSSSDLKMLESVDFDNLEYSESEGDRETTTLAIPPEQIFYEQLQQKSHPRSLKLQLKFMMAPELRERYELDISDRAALSGHKALVPSNLQQASDLAIANLYWYFKARDESEEEIEEAVMA